MCGTGGWNSDADLMTPRGQPDPGSDESDVLIGIAEVSRRTGVGISTLRAWERRHNLLLPRRTAGGHRLYAAADVELVRWVAARTREGLRFGDALRMARARPDLVTSARPAHLLSGSKSEVTVLREAWIAACLRLDEAAAESIILKAFTDLPTETACTEILQAGIRAIGDLWLQGAATPHQEHFASALASRGIATLMAATPPPSRTGLVFCGCAAGDEHGLAAQLIAFFFRQAGWPVTFLAANVPVEGLAQLVDRHRPDLIILSAQSPSGLCGLALAALALRSTGIPLGYGGDVCNRMPAMREAMPALFLGESIPTAVATAEAMLAGRAGPSPALPTADPELSLFRQRRLSVEATVWRELIAGSKPPSASAITSLGDLIEVALVLGRDDILPHTADALADLVDPLLNPPRLIDLADAYGRALEPCRIAGRLLGLSRR